MEYMIRPGEYWPFLVWFRNNNDGAKSGWAIAGDFKTIKEAQAFIDNAKRTKLGVIQ